MKRRFAVFDIDGTFFRWQLYHELFDAFVENGVISNATAKKVLEAREAWRKRLAPYLNYENILVKVMEEAIVGFEVQEFNAIADHILDQKGHRIYNYTLALLNKLRKEGYATIAISGSHQQLVERFSALHNIELSVGRSYVIKDNALSGVADDIFGNKDKILRRLVREHNLSWTGSYGVGDSGGDISMLELVENPIAFNPNSSLLDEAKKRGWPIVIERKSITYKLEKGSNGTYILAQTNSY